MLSTKSQDGAKPAGLIYIVVYAADRQKVAAAVTVREMGEEVSRAGSAV